MVNTLSFDILYGFLLLGDPFPKREGMHLGG